jgi:hypothetical protein
MWLTPTLVPTSAASNVKIYNKILQSIHKVDKACSYELVMVSAEVSLRSAIITILFEPTAYETP